MDNGSFTLGCLAGFIGCFAFILTMGINKREKDAATVMDLQLEIQKAELSQKLAALKKDSTS